MQFLNFPTLVRKVSVSSKPILFSSSEQEENVPPRRRKDYLAEHARTNFQQHSDQFMFSLGGKPPDARWHNAMKPYDPSVYNATLARRERDEKRQALQEKRDKAKREQAQQVQAQRVESEQNFQSTTGVIASKPPKHSENIASSPQGLAEPAFILTAPIFHTFSKDFKQAALKAYKETVMPKEGKRSTVYGYYNQQEQKAVILDKPDKDATIPPGTTAITGRKIESYLEWKSKLKKY